MQFCTHFKDEQYPHVWHRLIEVRMFYAHFKYDQYSHYFFVTCDLHILSHCIR
jgi:hypothetical protein